MNRLERLIEKKKLNLRTLKSIIKGTKWSGKQYFNYCVPNALIYRADRLNSCSECDMLVACKCRLLEKFGEALK